MHRQAAQLPAQKLGHSCMLRVGCPGLCFAMIPVAPVGLGAFINVKIRQKKRQGSVSIVFTEGKLFGCLVLPSVFRLQGVRLFCQNDFS